MFLHLVKQPPAAFGGETLADLAKSFETQGYNIRKLMVDVLASSALTPRRPDGAASVASAR
jgi:hypothetical protein